MIASLICINFADLQATYFDYYLHSNILNIQYAIFWKRTKFSDICCESASKDTLSIDITGITLNIMQRLGDDQGFAIGGRMVEYCHIS